jgi:hypothetical protein
VTDEQAGSFDRRVGPPPVHIIETEVKGDISLFDAERNQVLVLNTTASDVWRLCDGEHTVDEIVALLASAYQTTSEEVRDDIASTIEQFQSEGFLP